MPPLGDLGLPKVSKCSPKHPNWSHSEVILRGFFEQSPYIENCIWTAPAWTDRMSAPAEDVPRILKNTILKRSIQKHLQKSPLGTLLATLRALLPPKASKRVPKGCQKGVQNIPKITKTQIWVAKGVPALPRGAQRVLFQSF